MKKITITLVATIAILFFFTGCDRTSKDFRNQWIGDWDFVVEKFWFEGKESGLDTIYYLGKISYGKKADELKVKYIELERDIVILKVKENGTIIDISSIYGNGIWNGYFDGEDTLHLYIRSTTDGQGGGGSHTIDGIKKKGGKNE